MRLVQVCPPTAEVGYPGSQTRDIFSFKSNSTDFNVYLQVMGDDMKRDSSIAILVDDVTFNSQLKLKFVYLGG